MQLFNSTIFLALGATLVHAHSDVTRFFVDGVDQGPAIAYRMNPDGSKFSSPVENLASDDMACGFQGTNGVSRVAAVSDGATLTFNWNSWGDGEHQVIDPGHKGPISVYMKKVDSAVQDPGTGDGWFKIWDDGYDEVEKTWAVNKLIAANGLLSVQVPQGLVGGYYLVRPELLALHNAVNGDPQFYTGCAQIFLKSDGKKVPLSTVSIPGHVKAGEPSVSFNLYYNPNNDPYQMPGPAVATYEESGTTTQTEQTEGLKPEGCILESGDWCGVEVPDYNTEAGCWASGQNCWDQGNVCWNTAPPTGGAGCTLWQDKCKDIQSHCSAKDFVGPPNKGKDLTPPKQSITPPAPLDPTKIGSSIVTPVATGSKPAGSGSAAPSLSRTAVYTDTAPTASIKPVDPPVKIPSVAVPEPTQPAASPSSEISIKPVESNEPVPEAPESPVIGSNEPAPEAPEVPVVEPPKDECAPPTLTSTVTEDAVTVTATVTASASDFPVNPVKAVSTDAPATGETSATGSHHRKGKHHKKPHWPRPSHGFSLPSGVAMPTGFKRVPRPTAPPVY